MTTEPGRAAPTSVVVAKILAVGASAGSMLLLMAAMAAGQQHEATTPSVDPTSGVPQMTVGQVPSDTSGEIGSSVARNPVPETSRALPSEQTTRSWSAPRRVSTPAATTATRPAATPAPPPTPRPVVQPAPPTRVPDAKTHAS
jgi:hypothetical protein